MNDIPFSSISLSGYRRGVWAVKARHSSSLKTPAQDLLYIEPPLGRNGRVLNLCLREMPGTALVLRTPGFTSSGEQEDAATRSRQFHFPYPTAYEIQLALMTALFEAIEQGKFGVFESPTGTGKTLSLLCSTITWLRMNRQRHEIGEIQSATQNDDHEEPDWVVAHDEAKQRHALQQQEEQLRVNLKLARERLAEQRSRRELPRHPSKRSRREDDPPSDDDFLPVEYDDEATSRALRPPVTAPGDIFLTPEVRSMMQAYEASQQPSGVVKEPETKPKIFFASRTHSQLAQLVQELKKTPFGHADDPVRCIGLGSRQHMCVHEGVRRWGRMFGTEAMNERCLEMMEGRNTKRCEFLPPRDAAGQAQLDAYRDLALAEVQDMEELVQLGKQVHTCPYFGARHSVQQAEIVTLPYNLLLQHDAREALQLSLDGSIVLIDEAHNLIDTILSTYTAELTQTHIDAALSQVNGYLQRFASRLRGSNEEHMRTLQVLLRALQAFCEQVTTSAQPLPSLTTAQLIARLGGTADQINVCITKLIAQLVKLEHWLKQTRIAKKVRLSD